MAVKRFKIQHLGLEVHFKYFALISSSEASDSTYVHNVSNKSARKTTG